MAAQAAVTTAPTSRPPSSFFGGHYFQFFFIKKARRGEWRERFRPAIHLNYLPRHVATGGWLRVVQQFESPTGAPNPLKTFRSDKHDKNQSIPTSTNNNIHDSISSQAVIDTKGKDYLFQRST